MNEYKCWVEDEWAEEDAHTVFAWRPEDAAQEFGKYQHAHNDYPDEQDINVKDDKGVVTKWVVIAEPDIHFYTRERKT